MPKKSSPVMFSKPFKQGKVYSAMGYIRLISVWYGVAGYGIVWLCSWLWG